MKADLIVVEGYDFINIIDYRFSILPNSHGSAVVRGNILTAKKEEYI